MIGPLELLLVLVIVLLIFGARRLPSLGRELGSGMREFKEGITQSSPRAEEKREIAASLDAGGDRPSRHTSQS